MTIATAPLPSARGSLRLGRGLQRWAASFAEAKAARADAETRQFLKSFSDDELRAYGYDDGRIAALRGKLAPASR
ncbi:MAG: hypothetical protein NW215_02665 [Hyphomicrobiales bacterium]|nr:hypothetical protein [Hyphomicrobiales bacterium]